MRAGDTRAHVSNVRKRWCSSDGTAKQRGDTRATYSITAVKFQQPRLPVVVDDED